MFKCNFCCYIFYYNCNFNVYHENWVNDNNEKKSEYFQNEFVKCDIHVIVARVQIGIHRSEISIDILPRIKSVLPFVKPKAIQTGLSENGDRCETCIENHDCIRGIVSRAYNGLFELNRK